MDNVKRFFDSAVGHFLKVLAFVFLSAGLTAALGEVTKQKDLLGPMAFVAVTGVINAAIVWVQKLQDPSVPNLPKFK